MEIDVPVQRADYTTNKPNLFVRATLLSEKVLQVRANEYEMVEQWIAGRFPLAGKVHEQNTWTGRPETRRVFLRLLPERIDTYEQR